MTPWILAVGIAVAQESVAGSGDDYNDGYRIGWAYGASAPTAEWALYGAAGSCTLGATGCLAVTAIGYFVEPSSIPPLTLDGPYTVPEAYMGTTPAPPPGTQDPGLWTIGYEDGWAARVKRDRARWAFAGGATVPIVVGTAYVGLVASGVVLSTF